VADALYSREMVLIDLGPRYLAAVARRDEAVTEIEGLKASSAELLRRRLEDPLDHLGVPEDAARRDLAAEAL